MAGPQLLLREICPPVVASSGGAGGNDGYLTAQQYEDLVNASGGGAAFQYTVAIGDNDDFTVPIPAALQPSSTDYKVDMTIQSGSMFTLYRIPFANQATTEFRVLTDATLVVGTLLAFTITEF